MSTQWIKCSDRLPKEVELVLAYTPSIVRIGYIWDKKWYKFENAGEQDSLFWGEVTHWMPLPLAPKE